MLKIAYDAIYAHPLPLGHRFPMLKYELLPEQLIHEGTCTVSNFFTPSPIKTKYVLQTHDKDYYTRLTDLQLSKSEIRKMGFPLSKKLIEREHIIAQGTLEGCRMALQYGVSMNIAGGTHHAFYDYGEAFCLLNDQAIAAHSLLHNGWVKKILILDLDVHQGNGTASIFKNESRVFTFSMHGKNNYPFKKEQSDWDIPLEDHTHDSSFLSILEKALSKLIEKVEPDFIFYLAGVDVLSSDKLGRLGLSLEGCKERDKKVFQMCKEHKIPVQCSMGGGYSPDIKTIVEAHANTFRMAQHLYF